MRCARWTFPISRSPRARAIAGCTTASSIISAIPRRRCCSACMRRPPSPSPTVMQKLPARPWPRRCIPMSGCCTPPWPCSTPGATACRCSCSAPPARSTRSSAGPGSTGSTPRATRARWCANTPNGTTSRPRPAPRAKRFCAAPGFPTPRRKARSTSISTPNCRR